MSLLRATISGSYKASDGDIESFDDVVGILPGLDDDKARQMIRKRYARIWVGKTLKNDGEEKKYKTVMKIRTVHIDDVDEPEDLDGKVLSYVGKDIMLMNAEELQDLAAAKDLAAIPLYKQGDLAHCRRVAFAEYASKVLGWTENAINPKTGKMEEMPISWSRDGFNPKNYETILADDIIRRSDEHVSDIEETLDRENLNDAAKAGKLKGPGTKDGSRLSMEQLKAIAKEKGITYNSNISYEKLYAKVYPKYAAA